MFVVNVVFTLYKDKNVWNMTGKAVHEAFPFGVNLRSGNATHLTS